MQLAPAGVVLAAGAGRRFGGAKQLALYKGRPLVEHPIRALEEAGVRRIAVVLGAYADRICAEADLGAAEIVICEDWDEGQAASLRCAVAHFATTADAILVVLGDEPGLRPEAIRRVLAADPPARAFYDGRPGHPVVLPSRLFGAVGTLRGDRGARDLLADAHIVDCTDLGPVPDIDTPF
jgi:CTP:molybdopterin cytidylyltransferase MocA